MGEKNGYPNSLPNHKHYFMEYTFRFDGRERYIFSSSKKRKSLIFTDLYLDVQYKLKENGVKRIGFTLFSYFFFTLDKGDFLIASSICSFEMWV